MPTPPLLTPLPAWLVDELPADAPPAPVPLDVLVVPDVGEVVAEPEVLLLVLLVPPPPP
ncbi:MAG TPA: hypothetical protein VEQ59_14710 [Polyangiaceae bacterium]|nr:hypothetical protein [Polyangiaceae bacterium]